MPSFKNTFGKEETEKNLQYDNTAFLHFSVSLSVALIAVLLGTLIYNFLVDRRSKMLRQAKRYNILPKQVQLESSLQSKRLLSRSVICRLLLIGALVVVAMFAKQSISEQGSHLKGFDPYELLGVQFDTPPDRIKKAYR